MLTSELKYAQHQMLPVPFKGGLRQISHKVLGNWTEKVLRSAPLICISNKQHLVGKMSQSSYLALCSCIRPTTGRILSVFSWRHMYLCDSCTATVCWRGSSWQVTSWLSRSEWQLGDARGFSHSGSARHLVSIYYRSLGLRNQMCLYTWL